MKKSVLVLLMTAALLFGGLNLVNAQDQPAPKKDTVNMDSNAKPEFYYSTEDEGNAEKSKSGNSTVLLVAGAVVVIAGATVLLVRKKKK
ncbi:MAG TPA: LPXTG cell wall anchor domain-containing protein [Bacteroidales bacterium]|nr:LPXTG cell wall anchor domain-containing protein [Bacteroidales bacterium]